MSCYYPSLAVDYGVYPNGKRKIKFLPERVDNNIQRLRYKYGDDLLLLPCGKCLACKMTKARDWSIRSVLEMQYHDASCFLTITYDDKHYPGKLVKNHLSKFFKTLRNCGYKFRFLSCGELGEHTKRAHYHAIIFGVDFSQLSDAVFWNRGSDGDVLYVSEHLNSLWKKGRILIGDATYESIHYTARYTTKKVDDDGSFILASNRPGIGYQWLIDHMDFVLTTDSVTGNFGVLHFAPLPRYFNSILKVQYPERYKVMIDNRMRKAKILNLGQMSSLFVQNLEEAFIYQEVGLDAKYKKLKRSAYD